MTPSIRTISLKSLLAYITDCHGLTVQELADRDINVKSKADVADAIECYGWSTDCFNYCN
jgi:hypothetical protein